MPKSKPQEDSSENVVKEEGSEDIISFEKPKRTYKSTSESVLDLQRTSFVRDGKVLCLTRDQERGFMIDLDKAPPTVRGFHPTDTEGAEEAYSWAVEIQAWLPDRRTLERNIRLGLWKIGAIQPSDAKNSAVRANPTRQFWPYNWNFDVQEEQ